MRLHMEESAVGFQGMSEPHPAVIFEKAEGIQPEKKVGTSEPSEVVVQRGREGSTRPARVSLSGMGPKTLLSDASTAGGRVLRWRMAVCGNSAVEFGAVPEALSHNMAALHTQMADPLDESARAVGFCSNITAGSCLPYRVPVMVGTIIEIVARRGLVQILMVNQPGAQEMQWHNNQAVPRVYRGPSRVHFEMEFPSHYDVRLAATLWAKASFDILQSVPGLNDPQSIVLPPPVVLCCTRCRRVPSGGAVPDHSSTPRQSMPSHASLLTPGTQPRSQMPHLRPASPAPILHPPSEGGASGTGGTAAAAAVSHGGTAQARQPAKVPMLSRDMQLIFGLPPPKLRSHCDATCVPSDGDGARQPLTTPSQSPCDAISSVAVPSPLSHLAAAISPLQPAAASPCQATRKRNLDDGDLLWVGQRRYSCSRRRLIPHHPGQEQQGATRSARQPNVALSPAAAVAARGICQTRPRLSDNTSRLEQEAMFLEYLQSYSSMHGVTRPLSPKASRELSRPSCPPAPNPRTRYRHRRFIASSMARETSASAVAVAAAAEDKQTSKPL